jgi:hypothetical protein
MASVSNYVFNNMARIGNDNCDTTEKNLQNTHQSAWSLTNYFAQDCTMKQGIDFALTAPAINYTGSHQVGVGGCNIDINSGLKYDPISRPPCRISLFQRPFATVPYLGRGSVDPIMEAAIMQGDQISNRKTTTSYSEKSYLNHQYTPMIPSLANNINNPANLVEGVAVNGWVRGGASSRDLSYAAENAKLNTTNSSI